MAVVTDKTMKELVQGVGGIDTSGLAKDTTLQAINNTLQNLQIDVNQTASNVSFDNTTSGLSATNVQGAIDELNNKISDNSCAITRQSGVSSTTPLPTITRRGRVIIIHFAQQFPSGTYYDLYNVTPLPTGSQHAVVSIGNTQDLIYLSSDGKMRFNNSKTFSSNTYVIGQLIYVTDD